MKIDYSKWIIRFQGSDGSNIAIENPSESLVLWAYFNLVSDPLTGDDPIKHIKELAKRDIRKHYLSQQLNYLSGKTLPVEDNLDYIEREAQEKGLI